ncbi:MAG: hydrogenase maturation nickel metallochaperone HypA [Flavobacterium sp.]|nr:hydrogenase maturation nickel metallochaperone HypA [Flavobacterium sp.]
MHELSIVTSIIKTAEFELETTGGGKIVAIVLEIGKLSGVEIQSLHFVWELVAKNTVLENSKITIFEPEGIAICAECETEYKVEKIYDSCPKCNSPFKKIISGRELKIKKLIIN